MSAPPVDPALVEAAVAIARAAGDLTLGWFRSGSLTVEQKGDGSPVTAADRAAERFVRDELARRYPQDAVAGEEEVDTPGTSGRRWTVDPIDGTKAFTRGVPLFSTLLALDDEHGPAVGVIHLPALSETVYAGRGRGCFCNEAPARVSTEASLARACLTTCGFDDWPDAMLAGARASGAALRTWGDGYGYALVATGRVEAMVDPIIAPHDVAAMPVIMQEAGGRYSDLRGSDSITSGDAMASNGLVHDELLALLAP